MVQVSKQVAPSQQIGAYLKKELADRKISQERFATMVFVEPRTVRRWIRDGINNIDTVFLIADQLGVSIGDILANCRDVPAFFTEFRGKSIYEKAVFTCDDRSFYYLFDLN